MPDTTSSGPDAQVWDLKFDKRKKKEGGKELTNTNNGVVIVGGGEGRVDGGGTGYRGINGDGKNKI